VSPEEVKRSAQAHEPEIVAAQIDLLYGHGSVVLLGVVAVATAVVAMLWQVLDRGALLLWLSANLLLSLILYFAIRRYHHQRSQEISMDLRIWARWFAFSSLLSGCLWASATILLVDESQLVTLSLVFLVVTGMVAGSIASLAIYLPAYYLYMFPTTLSLLHLVARYDEFANYLFMMVTVFLISMILLGRQVNRVMIESIRQRTLNLDLVAALDRQKRQAEQAYEEKSRFLAAASHDLRQPLQALTMFHEAMQHDEDPAQRRLLLGSAIDATHSLSSMLNQLFSLSQLESGQIRCNPQLLLLRPLLAAIVQETEGSALRAGVQIRLRCGANLAVTSDPLILGRIVRNLLANTVSHCPGSRVLLAAQRRGQQVLISVRDTGEGIAAAAQSAIFDEYVQLHNPQRDSQHGLGLGLSIVRRLVNLLGSEIRLVSYQGQRHGSCFSFMLPMATSAAQRVETNEISTRPDLCGLFVLLVEDNRDNLFAMRSLLRLWECEVLAVESLAAAEIAIQRDGYPPPDVILTDWRLADGVTARDVAQAMARIDGRELPLIVMSGDIDPQIAQAIATMGGTLLLKPLQPEELARHLRPFLPTDG
jgi:two-component system, sensor histidine kinase